MLRNLFILALPLFLFACGKARPAADNSLDGKKKQLSDLQTQVKEIEGKIASLQAEIAVLDTVKIAPLVKNVQVATAAPENFAHYVDVQGFIDAKDNVMVTVGIPGLVKNVFVKEGQMIAAGQLIATLDAKATEETIKQLEINLQLTKIAYEKQKALWDQQIGSEIQYLQAKNTYESLLQQIEVVKSQLAYSQVTAPMGGLVEKVFVKPGEAGITGMPLIRIVNLNTLIAKANVADTYLDDIKQNNPVRIILPTSNDTLNSRISLVGKTINIYSRTFEVEAPLLGKSRSEIKPNMYIKLSVNDRNVPNAIVVSENIVQSDDKGDFVLIAVEESGKTVVRKNYIKKGLSYNGRIVIESGLKPGDRYISLGYQTLSEGQFIALQ